MDEIRRLESERSVVGDAVVDSAQKAVVANSRNEERRLAPQYLSMKKFPKKMLD